MHPTHRSTIRDVAKAAGVHPSTVSRALRNHSGLPETTLHRIQTIARELNYRPDPLISALVSKRYNKENRAIGTIAWIDTLKEKEGWLQTPFQHTAFYGAQRQAAKKGYQVERFWLGDPNMTASRLSDILYHRGIRGVCIPPMMRRSYLKLKWDHFACAAIGYSMIRPQLHRVTPHHMYNMQTVLRTLRKTGHQRIGTVISRNLNRKTADIYLAAILLNQKRYGRNGFPILIHNFNHKEAWQQGKIWAHKHKLDALILIPYASSLINRESSLLTDLDIPVATLTTANDHFPFPYLDEKTDSVGAAAIDLIIGQIERNEFGIPSPPQVLMVEGVWSAPANHLPSIY